MYYNEVPITELIGKTLTNIHNGGAELIFEASDGSEYKMYHEQNCCEGVSIEDITGELSDLIGSPILKAEVMTNSENPKDQYEESFTWTFYHIATVKAHVTIRWYGSSNGYYSESIDFVKIK